MPLIQKVDEMKKKGLKDEEISQRLREEDIPPREIDEAMDQSIIKSAVFEDIPNLEVQGPEEVNAEEAEKANPFAEYETEMPSAPKSNFNLPEEQYSPAQMQQPEMQQAQEQQYPEYEYAPPAQSDSGLIAEIADQIITEKTEEIQKQLVGILQFKIESQAKISGIEERLKRIESIIDQLQISILKKIGGYGKNVLDLKKEMQATQDSFSKILNPLAEHIKELKKIASEKKN